MTTSLDARATELDPATTNGHAVTRPSIRHPQLGEPIAVYHYQRASGDVAFVVCRFEPKDFRPAQLKGGRWVWNIKGAPALLYRFPDVERALAAGDTIWIADGEKDVDALTEFGVTATCSARAQSWTLEHAEQLTGARRIRIVVDRDGGTGAKQAAAIRDSLIDAGAIASADIELVQAAEGKDAFDHLAVGHGIEDFEPFVDEARDGNGPASHSWHPIDLLAGALAPPEPPAIGGIVYPGRRHVFSGEPESLKSWAMLTLCVDELRAGRTVAYVDFEMGRRETLDRLRSLGASDELIAEQLLYLEPSEPMTSEQVLADVRALIDARRPSLIAIDAFTGALGLHGCDPNSAADVERFYRTVVDELRAHGAAVVLLDHLPKDKEARGKFAIGSERKIGAADVHLRFEIVAPFGRGRAGRAKIETLKDRPGHLPRPRAAELELVSDPGTGAISHAIALADAAQPTTDFRPTALMEKVSIYVERCVDPPSRNQVEAGVKGKTDAKRLAIDTLVKEGYLLMEKGPRGANLLRSTRPYRQTDEPTSPSSPHLAPTSPQGEDDDFAHLAPPLQGGGRWGEVEVGEDELTRLEDIAEELGL